ncbi:hypothetical protein ACWDUD_20870 [Rhodococcus sp. NPDC003382]|uniref:hypothetical protein n=1 Tax=unclassified Rhodococcus (in: high G+C Gram-positive bacteria) TaxID=192944 RepID=UPI0018CFE4CB|nr:MULTISPECIES: hypothetical protein [unclassified Rhodococcus (in: high G+C Gram-positive bacteria)]MBH0121741.1 hypothetical protein [Rhodococcus sp. CX]MCK8673753.1 hypothetical protein [Rhodococcus sp. HM1]
MSTTEMQDLQRTIGHLRQCVGSLRSRYGDAPAVKRLANDLDRLDIDAKELDSAPPAEVRGHTGERIPVPDAPYDDNLFRGVDVDDEGLGGLHGER